MKLAEISKFTVIRETDLGYLLSDGESEEEYFLHRNESNFKILREGDRIDAFLYLDKKKRVTATCYMPKITLEKGGLVTCVSTTTSGAFFNIGISKDIMMSSDDYLPDERPLAGDVLPCKLRLRGTNSIYLKLLNKYQILELNTKDLVYQENDKGFGYVYRITKDGVNLVDEHYNIIFIHQSNIRGDHRLGEKINFTIIGINEDDYYGTTIVTKENMISDDSETILNYLKEHHGVMQYTESTDPLVIEHVFHMSKLSFKRALGHLYKQQLIDIQDTRIIMKR